MVESSLPVRNSRTRVTLRRRLIVSPAWLRSKKSSGSDSRREKRWRLSRVSSLEAMTLISSRLAQPSSVSKAVITSRIMTSSQNELRLLYSSTRSIVPMTMKAGMMPSADSTSEA